MANKFWVGSTGSWSDTTHWATSTGGAGSTGIPLTGDNVTFDGASGGGTVTADHASGLSLNNLTAGAFTGTIDWTGTNPNLTISGAMTLSGSGARKFLMGSGTFTFTSTAQGVYFDLTTTTNLDGLSVFTANFALSGNTANTRTFNGGGKTFGTLTIGSNTSKGTNAIAAANTFAALSLANGTILGLPATSTTTVAAAFTLSGSASAPAFITSNSGTTVATLSIASGTTTLDYVGLSAITVSGGGAFNATNSFDLGRNTGWTSITGPTGGGVICVIGG